MNAPDECRPVTINPAGILVEPSLHDAVLVAVSVIGSKSLLVFDCREVGTFVELKVESERPPVLIAAGLVLPAIIFDAQLLRNPSEETLVAKAGQEVGRVLYLTVETYLGTDPWFLLFGNSYGHSFGLSSNGERFSLTYREMPSYSGGMTIHSDSL